MTGMIIEPKGKQVEVLGKPNNGHFVVLGTAGSGKTTIALLRAINLANLPGNDKVLLVTFNGALVEYMKGIENISGRLTVENYHKFARGYLASRGKMPTYGGIAENEQRESLIDSAVEYYKEKYPDESTYKRKNSFFYDEIKFIQEFGCDCQTADYLRRFPQIISDGNTCHSLRLMRQKHILSGVTADYRGLISVQLWLD